MRKIMGLLMGAALLVAGPAISAAPASAATTGNQRFIVILHNDDSKVIAAGPISGTGEFQEGATEDDIVFVFPEGSLFIHAPNAHEDDSFNEAACVGRFTFDGPWTVTQGTGAYAGATGSGQFQGRGLFVGQRTADGCSEDDSQGTFVLTATVSGTLTIP